MSTVTVPRRISAGPDDVHVYSSHEAFITANSNLIVGTYSSGYYGYSAGLRFTDVQVPKGAMIKSAYITFRAHYSDTSTQCYTRFYGEAADNPARITSYNDFTSRARTGKYVNWIPSAWSAGSDYNSPELKEIIKEIVDRGYEGNPGNWQPGNALQIFWQDNGSAQEVSNRRRASAYEGSSSYAPILTIIYLVPSAELAAQGTIEIVSRATLESVPPTPVDLAAQGAIEIVSRATLETVGPPVELAARGSIEIVSRATLETIVPDMVELAARGSIEIGSTAVLDAPIAPGYWIAKEAITEDTPNSVVAIVGVQRDGVWYYSEVSDALIVRQYIYFPAPKPIRVAARPLFFTNFIGIPAPKPIYVTARPIKMSRLQLVVAIGVGAAAKARVRARTRIEAAIGIGARARAFVRSRTTIEAAIGILVRLKFRMLPSRVFKLEQEPTEHVLRGNPINISSYHFEDIFQGPREEKTHVFNFAKRDDLQAGETITQILAFEITLDGQVQSLMLESASIVSGKLHARIKSVGLGNMYKLSMLVLTSLGHKLEADGRLIGKEPRFYPDIEKQPREEKTYAFDFSGKAEIRRGEYIAEILGFEIDGDANSDMVVAKTYDNHYVYARVKEGSHGSNLDVSMLVRTNEGHKLEAIGTLKVREI